MSDARDEVLDRIRTALYGTQPSEGIRRAYRRADDAAACLTMLVGRLEDYGAHVHHVAWDQVAATVTALAPGRVVVPQGVPAEWIKGIHVVRDEPRLTSSQLDALDAVATTCALAIAETGTVVLDGRAGQGRRMLSLVPDHHVVLIRADQVVATVPQALVRLDARRAQTWISGPSATSDIELERVEGVHGPRRLDVVLIDAASGASRG